MKKGFDASPNLKKEDLLNRWGFAQEVYTIATRTPIDWSVRIGIYGSWGEGKTSVLKFINTLAKNDNQIVIWFNPWEFTIPNEMWESFVLLVLKRYQEAGIDVGAQILALKAKKLSLKALDTFQSLSQVVPYGEVGLPILKHFLESNKKIFTKLPQPISGKRIIVLIDDLDRANPQLIPQLLFAVKELLDLPGFTFILAFDPVIVNQTLKTNNIYYGQEKDFLDKIIDFPKWLPNPSEKDLLNLLRFEVKENISFLDFNFIEQVFPFLGNNPRKIKQFIRLFIGFSDEVKRYNNDEINWTVFLLVNIVKVKFPDIFSKIFGNKEIEKALFTRFWSDESNKNDEDPEYVKVIKTLTNQKITDEEQKDLILLIKEIIKLDGTYKTETFFEYAHLTERPQVVTWKEFSKIIEKCTDKTNIADLDYYIQNILKDSTYSETEIMLSFLVKTIEYWNWSLEQASESKSGKKTKSHIANAIVSLNLIEKISFDKNGFIGQRPFLDESHFGLIYTNVIRWIHFSMKPYYTVIRKKEKEILIKICNQSSINLSKTLFLLKPWNVHRSGAVDQRSEKELSEELSVILEERISIEIFDKLKINNWINSIFSQDGHFVEHYILLRKDSYFWSSELRQKFLRLLRNKKTKKILANNMFQFLSLIEAAFLSKNRIYGFIDKEDSILLDKELIVAIWKCAYSEEINPRLFKGIEEFKNDLKSKFSIDVPPPSWWERIKKIIEAREENENKH